MRRILALVIAAALSSFPAPGYGGDHLVSSGATQERLARASVERQQGIRAIQTALASPRAASAAASLGVPIDKVRAAVPTLGDRELRDLASRASSLQADPVAGHLDADVDDFLVIFLVVAIVAVVISAVD